MKRKITNIYNDTHSSADTATILSNLADTAGEITAQLGNTFFQHCLHSHIFQIIIFTDYLVSWFSSTRIDRVIGCFLFGASVLQSALTRAASCISVSLLGFLQLVLRGHDYFFGGRFSLSFTTFAFSFTFSLSMRTTI